MPRQIHAVVEQSQNIDNVISSDSEDHEMSASSSLSGNMQGAHACLNLVSRLGTRNLWPVLERIDRERHGFSLFLGLPVTEVPSGPA